MTGKLGQKQRVKAVGVNRGDGERTCQSLFLSKFARHRVGIRRAAAVMKLTKSEHGSIRSIYPFSSPNV
jgi:hypothetical protein